MKPPSELKSQLRRQWDIANIRQTRLLNVNQSWPVALPIGKPTAQMVRNDLDRVKRHVQAWRSVTVGHVQWKPVKYQAAAEPVDIPVQWIIQQPTQWVTIAADAVMREEFAYLSELVANSDPLFHALLVRRRALWRGKPAAEVIQAARLAMALTPNCAAGRPLRALPVEGIDTKFFQRNAGLVTSLLDVRYDGEVSPMGLESFLDARSEGSHWLLLADLSATLLPFRKMRVSSSELQRWSFPCRRVIIIENENCQHQLPKLQDTIAVLGAGFDLQWTANAQLRSKSVAYWGDIDTWGLQLLGKARANLPDVTPILMDRETFAAHRSSTVVEPVSAGDTVPEGLLENERLLYRQLLSEPQGRLEQEFLRTDWVATAIAEWVSANS